MCSKIFGQCVTRSIGWYLLLLGLLLAMFWPVQAQENPLTELSSNINNKLLNLKQEMQTLQDDLLSTTVQLQQASTDLRLSESERLAQQQLSSTLSTSLMTISEKLNNSYQELWQYKLKLEKMVKWVIVLGALCILRLLLFVVGICLYVKGIKVPRWVDIIL